MQFANPYFLYGLFALAIPVLIHLFNLRKFKKQEFTNVAFIREIKSQTKKSSQLKHLIVLIVRMMAVAAIVFAFARPFIPAEESLGEKVKLKKVSIYIDNSFSMQGESSLGPLPELAQKKAAELIKSLGQESDYQIIDNSKTYRSTPFISQDDALKQLQEQKTSVRSANINTLIENYLNTAPLDGNDYSLFVISDFQKGSFQVHPFFSDSAAMINLVHLSHTNNNNIAVDSCFMVSPYVRAGEQLTIRVILKNYGTDYLEKLPVKLVLNGEQRALSSVDLEPLERAEVDLQFTPEKTNNYTGFVEIMDYPVRFDDQYFISIHINPFIDVLCISETNAKGSIDRLYATDSIFRFERLTLGEIPYESLPSRDFIILENLPEIPSGLALELQKYIRQGGSLMMIPHAQADLPIYNSFLQNFGMTMLPLDTVAEKLEMIQQNSPFFSGVFENIPRNLQLPDVQQYYPIRINTESENEVLLSLRNGRPFLIRNALGNGQFSLFASALAQPYSDMYAHALFVPIMYKAAFLSTGMQPLAYTPANNDVIDLNLELPGDEAPLLVSSETEEDMIPSFRKSGNKLQVFLNAELCNQAGLFSLKTNNEEYPLALNYSRKESLTRFFTEKEIDSIARESLYPYRVFNGQQKGLGTKIMNMDQQLWRWFIIFALAFLAIEILLLRFWK